MSPLNLHGLLKSWTVKVVGDALMLLQPLPMPYMVVMGLSVDWGWGKPVGRPVNWRLTLASVLQTEVVVTLACVRWSD